MAMRPWGYGLALAGATAAADQLVKWWVLTDLMRPPAPIEVAPFFNLVLVWNRGISFGLIGGGVGAWMFVGLAAAIVAVLGLWLARTPVRWVGIALGCVIGGAVGNVIDRLRFGAVVDFLDFHLAGYHWPAFNLADAAITVGVILLLVEPLFGRPGVPK